MSEWVGGWVGGLSVSVSEGVSECECEWSECESKRG